MNDRVEETYTPRLNIDLEQHFFSGLFDLKFDLNWNKLPFFSIFVGCTQVMPLFQISGDVSPGFQSLGWRPYSHSAEVYII